MSKAIIHLPNSKKEWYAGIDKSTGLKTAKRVKSLCGKRVSVYSIGSYEPTCSECKKRLMIIFDLYLEYIGE